MSQTFGIEAHAGKPSSHADGGGDPPTRFLVLIASASEGSRVAHVLSAMHDPVATFDASAPEVQLMTRGLAPQGGAEDLVWDRALGGHSAVERREAEVYTLDT